jgi:hypothetical protein
MGQCPCHLAQLGAFLKNIWSLARTTTSASLIGWLKCSSGPLVVALDRLQRSNRW